MADFQFMIGDGVEYPEGTSDAVLAGDDLCPDDQYFGVVWSVKGDLDWYNKGLGLRHYGSREPCEWCKASIGRTTVGMMTTNFTALAAWKRSPRTIEEWRLVPALVGASFSRRCPI